MRTFINIEIQVSLRKVLIFSSGVCMVKYRMRQVVLEVPWLLTMFKVSVVTPFFSPSNLVYQTGGCFKILRVYLTGRLVLDLISYKFSYE